ncbi:MAG: DctP family TRAP transporter solute-binding subunit [Spongiibacteraceae bacterium]|nr:DctP family TRAP transporter solute-binding subunit [Spongiibacteraceae bacterium]
MFRSIGLSILAVLVMTACGGSSSSGEGPILIKFSHVTSPATPKGQGADRFKHLVEERLQGRVKVEVYPSGQLLNDDDSLEALAFGEIQMVATSLSKFDRITHTFQLFDLPFLFPDLKAVERFQASAEGRSMLSEMKDRGFLGLAYWHNGMKQFGGPKAMLKPEDAAGLKFRIMESDVLQEQILQMKGNPQKMAFGEVYQALQTGAVDAQENTWSNIYSSKFFEVQPVLTETNHGYLGYLVAVNPSFWNSLPEDIRAELENIVLEVSQWVNERAARINQDSKEKIRASGRSEFAQLTEAQLQHWQDTMRPVWGKFEDNIGKDLIEAASAVSAQ